MEIIEQKCGRKTFCFPHCRIFLNVVRKTQIRCGRKAGQILIRKDIIFRKIRKYVSNEIFPMLVKITNSLC